MGNFAKLSITSFLEILRFLSLRWYQFPGTCNCHSLTWNKFVEHLARIWSMCNIPDENRSRKTTGSVSLWLGSSQHSSVCSLSSALKLHHQFKSFQQHQFQVKSLTSTLYSEFFCISYTFWNVSKQDRSFSSHLFFRQYGERHPEIKSTFNSMQLKKKYGGGRLGCLSGLLFCFLHFRDLLSYFSLQSCERLSNN